MSSVFLLAFLLLAGASPAVFNSIVNSSSSRAHSRLPEDDDEDNFGLSLEDYDYELEDVSHKFHTLPEKSLVQLAAKYDPSKNFSALLDGIRDDEVVQLINARPEMLVLLSTSQLEGVLVHRADLVLALQPKTLDLLSKSEVFAKKMTAMSKPVLASFLTRNEFVVDFLKTTLPKFVAFDSTIPAMNLLRSLITDDAFLRMLPRRIHVELAESDFRKFLGVQSSLAVLKARPDVPLYFGPTGMAFVSNLLKHPEFVTNLPCSVVLNAATHPGFVDKLNGSDLRLLTKEAHFWNCLPVEVVREVMKNGSIAHKVSLTDVIRAAKVMSKAKSIDMQVVTNIFQHQFPTLAENIIKG